MKLQDTPGTTRTLLRRLNERSATVGILGLGYIGLPLALRYAEVGYRVIGFDVDQAKIEAPRRGASYIKHIRAANIAAARKDSFEASGNYSPAGNGDALIICVPTPLNKHREPDLSRRQFHLASVPLVPEIIGSYDAVLLATDHDGINYELVRRHAQLIVDTRGVYLERVPNAVKA
jgi:UDP-N-acetyl-D-glucosamine dehydrogenase